MGVNLLYAENQECELTGTLQFRVEIRSAKYHWIFTAMENQGCLCILDIDLLKFVGTQVNFHTLGLKI